jgi:hypothetical protein
MRDKQGMWLHYCRSDYGWYAIGPDEACTWCDHTEGDEPPHFLTAPGASDMDTDRRSRADSTRI